jgi:hypothetical protein
MRMAQYCAPCALPLRRSVLECASVNIDARE